MAPPHLPPPAPRGEVVLERIPFDIYNDLGVVSGTTQTIIDTADQQTGGPGPPIGPKAPGGFRLRIYKIAQLLSTAGAATQPYRGPAIVGVGAPAFVWSLDRKGGKVSPYEFFGTILYAWDAPESARAIVDFEPNVRLGVSVVSFDPAGVFGRIGARLVGEYVRLA